MKLGAAKLPPLITWGTSPEQVTSITGHVPVPAAIADEHKRKAAETALAYMGLKGGEKITDIAINRVFIGSCTNARIEDLREVARVVDGKMVNPNVYAMIVPGSGLVKEQAEAEGLHKIFTAAGFEWREPGCSMCLAMNPDKLKPGERCASTSNRNFEGRQGSQGAHSPRFPGNGRGGCDRRPLRGHPRLALILRVSIPTVVSTAVPSIVAPMVPSLGHAGLRCCLLQRAACGRGSELRWRCPRKCSPTREQHLQPSICACFPPENYLVAEETQQRRMVFQAICPGRHCRFVRVVALGPAAIHTRDHGWPREALLHHITVDTVAVVLHVHPRIDLDAEWRARGTSVRAHNKIASGTISCCQPGEGHRENSKGNRFSHRPHLPLRDGPAFANRRQPMSLT